MHFFTFSNEKICRVCEATEQLFSLALDSNKSVLKKLRACADISIDLQDQLPKQLCKSCSDSLDLAYKFKIKCEYTDQKLRDEIIRRNYIKTEPIAPVVSISNNDCEDTLQVHRIAEANNKEILPQNAAQLSNESEIEPELVIGLPEHETNNIDKPGGIINPTIVELNGVSFEDYTNIIEDNCIETEEVANQIVAEQHTDNTNEDEALEDDPGNMEETYLSRSVSSSLDYEAQEIIKIEGRSRLLVESVEVLQHVEHDPNELEEDEEELTGDFGEVYDGYNMNDGEGEPGQIEEDASENEEILEKDANYDENMVSGSPQRSFKINSDTAIVFGKNKQFICDTCNEQFTNFTEFNQHKKSHGNQRYQCPICGRWFSKRYHMKNHQTIHEGQKLFNCTLCSKRYTNQGNLDRHVRVFHNQEKTHVCDLCGKGFSQSTILRQHYSVHIQVRNFECDICHKRYKTQDYLNLHKNRHLPPELRTIKTYTSNKKYKPIKKICFCTFCGKKSNSVALHQSHMRTHTGERPFECYVCKKRFSFQQSLKSHVLLHTGEKPFKCEDCGMAFRQVGHLKGHKLTHSGQKQHTCTICSKSFALRGNLTVHMRLHTGETPYHCTFCTKRFYDSNGLKRHKQVHIRNRDVPMTTKSTDDESGAGGGGGDTASMISGNRPVTLHHEYDDNSTGGPDDTDITIRDDDDDDVDDDDNDDDDGAVEGELVIPMEEVSTNVLLDLSSGQQYEITGSDIYIDEIAEDVEDDVHTHEEIVKTEEDRIVNLKVIRSSARRMNRNTSRLVEQL